MYSKAVLGPRGVYFDSKAEASVAETLEDLMLEKIVASYMVHPMICGFEADFLVQLGPRSNNNGRLVIVEYDGLGTKREESVMPKITQYAELTRAGIFQLWIQKSDFETVKGGLENPGMPRVIQKIIHHETDGREESIHVLGDESMTIFVP